MADHIFFAKQRRANEREVVLQNATLLVGKAPTKQKRIRMKFQMPLSAKKTAGTPEWISAAHEFVAKNHDTVTPEIKLRGYDIEFSAEQLFGDKSVKTPKSQMQGFEITEVGDAESPDVVMHFAMYAPFSTTLWRWVGQMAGESFWAKFTEGEPEADDDEEEGDLELTAEEPVDEAEEEDEEEDDDEAA